MSSVHPIDSFSHPLSPLRAFLFFSSRCDIPISNCSRNNTTDFARVAIFLWNKDAHNCDIAHPSIIRTPLFFFLFFPSTRKFAHTQICLSYSTSWQNFYRVLLLDIIPRVMTNANCLRFSENILEHHPGLEFKKPEAQAQVNAIFSKSTNKKRRLNMGSCHMWKQPNVNGLTV